jgi:hypothetical protein
LTSKKYFLDYSLVPLSKLSTAWWKISMRCGQVTRKRSQHRASEANHTRHNQAVMQECRRQGKQQNTKKKRLIRLFNSIQVISNISRSLKGRRYLISGSEFKDKQEDYTYCRIFILCLTIYFIQIYNIINYVWTLFSNKTNQNKIYNNFYFLNKTNDQI